jgi:O-antigen/teichoic acid export membrane protein
MKNEIFEIASKSLISFIGNIFGQVFSFVFLILIGRTLGAQLYGEFVYLQTIITLISIFQNLGLGTGIVSLFTKNSLLEYEKKNLLSTILFFTFFICLVLIGIAQFINVLFFASTNYYFIFMIMLPTILLNGLNEKFLAILRSMKKITEITIVSSFFSPLVKILSFYLFFVILKFSGLISLILATYLSLILVSFYSIIFLFKKNQFGEIKFNSLFKKLIKLSFPLFLSGILTLILHEVDKIMIGNYLSSYDLGIYKIILQIGLLSTIFSIALNSIFAPIISTFFHENKIQKINTLYKLTTKWVFLLNLFFWGLLVLLGENILLIFGSDFLSGYLPLVIISFGNVLVSSLGSAGTINVMMGNTKIDLYICFFSMVLNVILNFSLIPILGILGSAISISLSTFSINFMHFIYLYFTKKLLPFDLGFINIIITFIVSFFFSFLAKYYFNFNFLLSFMILPIIYSFFYIPILINYIKSFTKVSQDVVI